MTSYRVRFRVGSDRQRIETVITLSDGETTDAIPRKLAARGLTSPWQFPASAVKIISTTPLSA